MNFYITCPRSTSVQVEADVVVSNILNLNVDAYSFFIGVCLPESTKIKSKSVNPSGWKGSSKSSLDSYLFMLEDVFFKDCNFDHDPENISSSICDYTEFLLESFFQKHEEAFSNYSKLTHEAIASTEGQTIEFFSEHQ
jgi:hypothetical protein